MGHSVYSCGAGLARASLHDGEPWFVASDVAAILGCREAYDLTRMLDDDEKGPHILRTLGGEQKVTIDGEPWFVGKDVAEARGYSNPQKAVRDHCRAPRPIGGERFVHPSALDPQTIIISEPDMLRLFRFRQ